MSPAPAVTFNYNGWKARYPEFADVSSDAATAYFNEATIYCRNSLGPVSTVALLSTYLNMITAHIAWLYSPRDASGNPSSTGTQPAPALVGRVSSATQGSVTVAVEMPTQPAAAAWFQQTKYGASFWEATKQYRTMRYLPRPQIVPGFGPWWGR